MDIIRKSVSFLYDWEFVFSFPWSSDFRKSWVWLVVSGKSLFRFEKSFLVMKLPNSLADQRAHGHSGLMVNFLPKRVGA
jgi:hypothetical protein